MSETKRYAVQEILAECRTIAEKMTTTNAVHLINKASVTVAVRDHFPWIRYDTDLMLITGMLAGSLSMQGWDIID